MSADKTGHMTAVLGADGTAKIERATAESVLSVSVARGPEGLTLGAFDVAESIDVARFPDLLDLLCRAAGLRAQIHFQATKLSSSHVVLEDTALALGAGLFELMRSAMETTGANGAGSSLRTAEAFETAPVSAAISVEGRKFLKMIGPVGYDDFRWRLILGHEAFGGLRTEDIDDFLDALAGGMRASIFLYERRTHDSPDRFWRAMTAALGSALDEAFAPNPARRGLPPGVKATLF